MNVNNLDAVIKRFWKNKGNDTIYYLGYCSEFAVSLDKFTNKIGKIGKNGWFHTIYIWDGLFWDVRGKMDRDKLAYNMPVGGTSIPRPATPDELKHINDLLNVERVNEILKGLKDAKTELRL